MRRRDFLIGLAAAGLLGCGPSAEAQPPFEPTRFSVEVRGTGPDVILIPGLTAGPDVWASTVSAVPGYRYHLVHVAGMAGAAPRGNASGAIVAPLAEEIVRYIASRRLARPAIVGHSMGGTLAMMVAARRPELVGPIMVVDMFPQPSGLLGSSPDRMRGLADGLRDLAATSGGRRLLDSLIGSFGTNSRSGRSDPDVVGRAMHELAAVDLTPDLAAIRAPLTVVYASHNDGARVRAFERAYAGAAGASFVRIDDSGHMVMFDQPARFHEAVRSFLAN
jgi:pimeloyl-ACP methyl ester carboxylesterase